MNPFAWIRRVRGARAYQRLLDEISDALAAGRSADAQGAAERALALAEQTYGPKHPELATPLYVIASIHLAAGRLSEALSASRRALAIGEASPSEVEPPLPRLLEQLAAILERRGERDEVEALFRRIIEGYDKMRDPPAEELAKTLNRLALLLGRSGRREEAAPLFERALTLTEEALGPEHLSVAELLYNAATFRVSEATDAAKPAPKNAEIDVFRSAGFMTPALAQAEAWLRHALAITQKHEPEGEALRASILHNLAVICEEAQRSTEAMPLYEEALERKERLVGKEHSELRPTLVRLARLLHDAGKIEAARPLYQRALALSERDLGPEHDVTIAIRTWLSITR